MRIMLTGGSGQLGTELLKLRPYLDPSHNEMDITDLFSVEASMEFLKPDLIVHAAAYTNTTAPEYDSDEASKCYLTNVWGTRNLMSVAKCPIIFISTENALHPYNFYVCTKLAAESYVKRYKHGYKIIRTSFREDPFEYPKAATDMFTIADSVDKIAELINKVVHIPVDNTTIYIGTGVKTVYELAKRTRPDVKPLPRSEISPILPSMEELLNI